MSRTSRRDGAEGRPGDVDLPPLPLREALAELSRLTTSRPELQPLGVKVSCLLRAAFGRAGSATPRLIPGSQEGDFLMERIQEGWNEGVPVGQVLTPSLDPHTVLGRLMAINDCAGVDQPGASLLRDYLETRGTEGFSWISILVEQWPNPRSFLPTAGPTEVEYVWSVLRLGLLGELGQWSAEVCGLIGDGSWPSGECPVCGAPPSLAEDRGLERRRFLRCGWCGAGWAGARGRCAHCGTSDPRALSYQSAEEDRDRYRLIRCDACGGRLKVVATLAPLSAPGLVVAEIATLHLDFLPGEGHRSGE